MPITVEPYGSIDGDPVDLYTLSNTSGSEAKITNYGGIVVSLLTPDREGNLGDVVLGYDTLDQYLVDPFYFGGIIGRYANRIAGARFVLNDVEYALAQNDGENHLHGGIKGFDKVLWQADPIESGTEIGLKLSYLSADGEEGYPGNLSAEVRYILTVENDLKIAYSATTDKATIVNLTNHSYFNLSGTLSGDILSHELMINADTFTPAGEGLIPTGEFRSVEGTPLDFTQLMAIGARIEEDDEQLRMSGGYDQNWVLNTKGSLGEAAATLYDPASGRLMQMVTTEPGLQFYTGNFLVDGSGKGGTIFKKHAGLCLEAQHFPDSPNKEDFPSVVLNPGEKYMQTTQYKFSTT